MGRGISGIGPTSQQQQQINKIRSRLAVGAKGTYRFGGDGSTISEAPIFKRNSDGTITYRVVGKRILPYEKSTTIGVGDRPERERTTVSTGTIAKDGAIIRSKSETKEVVIKRTKKKR